MDQYDEKAAGWDLDPTKVKISHDFVESLLATVPLNDQMRAMDFGCGTGLAAERLAEHLGSIVGVDTSEGMLEVLRQKIDAQDIRNIEPMLLDVTEHCPFKESFDLIYSCMVFHHIDAYEDIPLHFCEMLKPGGIAAIADLDAEDGTFHSEAAIYEHCGFERQAFKAVLVRSGFTDIQDRTALMVPRDREEGIREYPVFLITGRKK